MRRVFGTALVIGVMSLAALAQPKPPPLEAPAAAAPDAGGGKFGAPLAEAAPPTPGPPAIPADELPAVTRFRALLGPATALAYRAAEPIDPAGGSVRLLGASLVRAGGRLEAEELTLDGLAEARIGAASAREVVLTLGDTVSRIARLELRGLAAPEPAAPGASAPGGLVLDSLRLDTLTVDGDQQLAIAEAVLEEFGPGRPGRLTLAGVDLLLQPGGTAGRLRIGRVALRGFDPGDLAGMLEQPPGSPPREMLQPMLLELEQAALSLDGEAAGTLGTLRFEGDPTAQGVDAGRLALRDLRIEPSPPLAEWLRRFGYPALLADLTAELRLDRGRQRIELGALSLAGREMGVLGLSLALEGVTPEMVEAADWEQVRLAGLTLRYLDQSLYARAVRDQARRLRLPEAKIREQWAAQAGAALAAGPNRGPTPGVAPVAAALQRFLRGEAKEVEITAAPPQPLPLGQLPLALLGGMAALQRQLGLTAAAR